MVKHETKDSEEKKFFSFIELLTGAFAHLSDLGGVGEILGEIFDQTMNSKHFSSNNQVPGDSTVSEDFYIFLFLCIQSGKSIKGLT